MKAEELQQYEDRQVTELRQAEEDLASKVYEQASAFKRRMRDKIDASEMAALEWMEQQRSIQLEQEQSLITDEQTKRAEEEKFEMMAFGFACLARVARLSYALKFSRYQAALACLWPCGRPPLLACYCTMHHT